MDTYTAKLAIIAKTNEVIALARKLYPGYIHGTPEIKFDIRGRSCGGRAWGHYRLQYNLDWYAANPTEYLNNTVTHEVAHIVAAATGLGKGHNAGWVRICLALGGNGQRCNTHPDVKAVPKARRTVEYLYRTDSGREAWVGPVHHNRLQSRGGVCPIRQRPMYALRSPDGRITRDGFMGQHRAKA